MAAYIHQGRVAFHETDAAGIVHFANYFHYAEEAETAALAQIGLLLSTTKHSYMLPRVHVEADYRHPLHFWEEYEVHAWINTIGQSSISWSFELTHHDILCAQMSWVSARLDSTGLKAPYSEEERVTLSQLLR